MYKENSMKKNEKTKLFIIVLLLLSTLTCLYFYFFKSDVNIFFWKDTGDRVNWNKIEYDDDFFPIDTVESYGELGEWKFKEFRPIYAGYGTTEDGLNYLIGKYLDGDGKEQSVKILVSGEGMAEWPFPDSGFLDFYDEYYRESVIVWPKEVEEVEIEEMEYEEGDIFMPLPNYLKYACAEEYLLTRDEVENYYTIPEINNSETTFINEEVFLEKCDMYTMYYPNGTYGDMIYGFEEVVDRLEVGEQFTVKYLETSKSFEDCRAEYDDVRKVFCANQNLNEIYDDYLVGIYIDL